jgi:hypothetical protein
MTLSYRKKKSEEIEPIQSNPTPSNPIEPFRLFVVFSTPRPLALLLQYAWLTEFAIAIVIAEN